MNGDETPIISPPFLIREIYRPMISLALPFSGFSDPSRVLYAQEEETRPWPAGQAWIFLLGEVRALKFT